MKPNAKPLRLFHIHESADDRTWHVVTPVGGHIMKSCSCLGAAGIWVDRMHECRIDPDKIDAQFEVAKEYERTCRELAMARLRARRES